MGDDELLSCRIKKRYFGFFANLLGWVIPPLVGLFLLAVIAAYAWASIITIQWALKPTLFDATGIYFSGGIVGISAIMLVFDLFAAFLALLVIDKDERPLIVYIAGATAMIALISALAKGAIGVMALGWLGGGICLTIILCVWGYLAIFYICEVQKQLVFIARKGMAASKGSGST